MLKNKPRAIVRIGSGNTSRTGTNIFGCFPQPYQDQEFQVPKPSNLGSDKKPLRHSNSAKLSRTIPSALHRYILTSSRNCCPPLWTQALAPDLLLRFDMAIEGTCCKTASQAPLHPILVFRLILFAAQHQMVASSRHS